MISDYLVKETLDFAEKILFGWTETSQKRRIDAQLALHRGMFFLSREMIDAALRLLDAPNPETRVQSLREFVAVVRREVGAVAIDEDTINGCAIYCRSPRSWLGEQMIAHPR